jgi:hypothetical protein
MGDTHARARIYDDGTGSGARAHHVAEGVVLPLDDEHGRTGHLGVLDHDHLLPAAVVRHSPGVEVIGLIHAAPAFPDQVAPAQAHAAAKGLY